MATVQRQEERRRFSRIAFHRPAQLRSRGTVTVCGVVDVSLKGALLEVPTSFSAGVGDRCTLVIRLDEGQAVIQLDGRVAHREGASLGVRCTAIDLDSIAHLRRLVELNLEDEALLHRELGALLGSDGM
jgi:hypothetical protein